MKQANNRHSFERFARQSFYTAVNQRLLDLISLSKGATVVDLGCGTGTITKLLLTMGKRLTVIAVDPSPRMLEEAKRNLGEAARGVIFIRARAEELSKHLPEKADALVFCNAIHMVHDKAVVIKEISKVLQAHGQFAFNTAFFDGAMPPPSLAFYRKLMLKTVRTLKSRYDVKHHKAERTEARRLLTPQEYGDLISAHGFRVRSQEVVEVEMPPEAVQAILEFDDFLVGALPGVPLSVASAALKAAAAEALTELGMQGLPRNWLQIVAEKA